MKIPRTRNRVVCALGVTIDSLAPHSRFSSVDFPAFGAPTIATKPQREVIWAGAFASAGEATLGSDVTSGGEVIWAGAFTSGAKSFGRATSFRGAKAFLGTTPPRGARSRRQARPQVFRRELLG